MMFNINIDDQVQSAKRSGSQATGTNQEQFWDGQKMDRNRNVRCGHKHLRMGSAKVRLCN